MAPSTTQEKLVGDESVNLEDDLHGARFSNFKKFKICTYKKFKKIQECSV
jgi:hypothetical protein